MKLSVAMVVFSMLFSTFAFADKKSDCETQVRTKTNKIVDDKVKEMEKKKAKYNRELIFSETKSKLFNECMKK